MKVLHIIPSVAPVRGGPSQAVLAMVKSLREQGIDAEIATTNDNGADLLNVPLHQLIEYQKVPVQFFPRFSPAISAVREFAFSGDLTQWLWQHIDDYQLLHIHAIFSYASTMAMAIARLKHIPYIVRPIGQLCEWSLQQSAQKKQIYLNLIEHANIDHSQALHFTSEQEKQETSQLCFKAPNFILPLGLSVPAQLPSARQKLRKLLKIADNQPVILFMSRLHPKKGLNYLIPALAKLTNLPFTFVLAGSGDTEYETEIDSLLQSTGMQQHTYRCGFVSGEMKQLLLQGADIFALTSHSENFGIAVLEALAAGLPVIVTPGVALASVIKKHQLGYVTELDEDKIASAIQSLLSDQNVVKQMSDRARQLILEEYTWEQIAGKLIAVYSAIINKQQII
ncbi:MAG TPA: glycosyltransferase [Oculatellaceae cyanobacterium]|jgi:glycosyltransferase involved in cell wall biosynthesis